MSPMKGFRHWTPMSATTADGNCMKNFGQSLQKQQRDGKEKKQTNKKTRMAIAKLFALHTRDKNTLTLMTTCLDRRDET